MLQRQDPIQTPVITLAVDDVDVALKIVETNGGATLEAKMPVGDTYLRDPEGNVMGLWQSAS